MNKLNGFGCHIDLRLEQTEMPKDWQIFYKKLFDGVKAKKKPLIKADFRMFLKCPKDDKMSPSEYKKVYVGVQ